MARDEALLCAQGPPTLRFYAWEPSALSLGYFQKYEEVDFELVESLGLDLVRRPTGGGAIAHINELTFCVSAPEGHPPYEGPVENSYFQLHRGFIEGFQKRLAANPSGAPQRELALRGGDRQLASDDPSLAFYCFYHSACPDIEWADRKLLGSAQRRRSGRVLHHGSLPLGPNPATPNAACLEQIGLSGWSDAVDGVLEGLRGFLGIEFEKEEMSESEVALAKELRKKYLDPTYLRRR